MPQLDAVLETALYVDDLERAARFYSDVLELQPLYRDNRLCAFSVGGRNVLLLFPRGGSLETVHMPGGTIPPHDGAGPVHVAGGNARRAEMNSAPDRAQVVLKSDAAIRNLINQRAPQ